MAKVNLSQAAKLVSKNRTTIWRHIKSGKLSSEKGIDGMPTVDTSELLRVYGAMQHIDKNTEQKKQQLATPSYESLIELIKELKKEQKEMRDELTNLTHRLTFSEGEAGTKKEVAKPEDDPNWPKQINTIDDITLRNQIKEKYNN